MFQLGSHQFDRAVFLAPMEAVTERPFRRQCRRFGADMVYTEFVSAEALIRDIAASKNKILLAPDEHPVGIQIYGNRREALVEAARLSEQMEPDVIDINFGCPVKKVACKGVGSGSGLLRYPVLLLELTEAVVQATRLPVTVKTRLGWDDENIIIVDLARRLEDLGVKALTLHARTRCQMFKGKANWDWIARVKEAVSIPVIGNGDVTDPSDVLRMFEHTNCDAVMIGRGAIGNPWIFSRSRALLDGGSDPGRPRFEDRVQLYLDLLTENVEEKGEKRAVLEMRKHISGYLRGMPNISWLRGRLMKEESLGGVTRAVGEYLDRLSDPGFAGLRDAEPTSHGAVPAGSAAGAGSAANADSQADEWDDFDCSAAESSELEPSR